MKIAFVGTFGLRPKGTVSARAVPLAEALVDRGHRVTVVTPPWDNPTDSGREIDLGKVRVLNIPLPPRIPILWYFILTMRLLRQTLRLQPEVVHVFKPKAFAGFVASALGLLNLLGVTNVRVVVDTDDWEGAGGWNETGDYSWLQRRLFPLQERWVLRQAGAITVASRALEEMVSPICGDAKKTFYLPNGVKKRSETIESGSNGAIRARLGIQGSPVVLLYTRFFEFGLARLLDVVADIVHRFPRTRLLVVGRGFAGEEKELDQLAQQRGLAQSITQIGWVDGDELPSYFAVADVAIYPYDDTLINRTKCSVKLLDLLNAGIPVVADRVGQNGEYIEDGKSGLLSEPGDSGTMAAAVARLVAEPDVARELGQQARQRVQSKFNWAVWAQQAERAYDYAATKKSSARMAIAWLPVALWMALIFYMSAQPSPPQLPEPLLQTMAAKTLHVAEYAFLAFLLLRSYRLNTFLPGGLRGAIVFSALVSVFYAISDETHQSFVPNRHPSPIDVLIDAAGASLALVLTQRRTRKTSGSNE